MKKSTTIRAAIAACILFLALTTVGARAQDVYEIRFTVDMTQYRAALVLYSNGTGTMRLRYFSEGRTQMVEQSIVFEKTLLGYRLTGYQPVYPGTTIRHASYIADNFYLSQDENGRLHCVNIDDQGKAAVCTIRQVTSYYAKNVFLGDFNWKLN